MIFDAPEALVDAAADLVADVFDGPGVGVIARHDHDGDFVACAAQKVRQGLRGGLRGEVPESDIDEARRLDEGGAAVDEGRQEGSR